MALKKTPLKAEKAATARVPRQRVRRGNEDDAEQLRTALLGAASELFAEGGLDAVSVRAVASRVGVSAMTPYRYFADKAELLVGLWQSVMQGLYDRMSGAANQHAEPRARVRASVEAFFDYWFEHPDAYRLVYMTERTTQREEKSPYASAPVYRQILTLSHTLTSDLASAIGAAPARVGMATDVRFTMMLGYAHTMLILKRYPWSDEDHIRAEYLQQVLDTTERCLLRAPVDLSAAAI